MIKKISIFLFLFFTCICTFKNIYAETDLILISENLINIRTSIKNVTYLEAVESIVKTLNQRDSYIIEIKNPEDYVKHLKSLKVDLPENLNNEITRIEFVSLLNDITEKMAKNNHYETNLINIEDIFKDLTELTEEQKEDVKIVFIEGILSGTSKNYFSPHDTITQKQLDIIMDRLLRGYSRKNLFSIVDSCYSEEERQTVLNGETDRILKSSDISSLFIDLIIEDSNSIITIKDFIDIINIFWNPNNSLFKYDEIDKCFYYLAEDTVFMSSEEWEFFNTHLSDEIMLSEALILSSKIIEAKDNIIDIDKVDNWNEILEVSENYLKFLNPLIKDREDCFSYFLNFSNPENINKNDFGRAVHECQHEMSARKGRYFSGRGKETDGTWYIKWSTRPAVHYYYDYTNDTYVDSKNNNSFPKTSILYNQFFPEKIKKDYTLEFYSTGYYSSNIYGLQGWLTEFCSFAIQSKTEYVSYSLGLNNSVFPVEKYKDYESMELGILATLVYLSENNTELFNLFINDIDVIRMINNIIKDSDLLKKVYSYEYSWTQNISFSSWKQELLEKQIFNFKEAI